MAEMEKLKSIKSFILLLFMKNPHKIWHMKSFHCIFKWVKLWIWRTICTVHNWLVDNFSKIPCLSWELGSIQSVKCNYIENSFLWFAWIQTVHPIHMYFYSNKLFIDWSLWQKIDYLSDFNQPNLFTKYPPYMVHS